MPDHKLKRVIDMINLSDNGIFF